jgi:hypothetical protein
MKCIAMIGVLGAAAGAFGQWSDDFNRADGPLGANWAPTSSFAIQGNRVQSTGAGLETVAHATASAPYATHAMGLDAICVGPSLQYAGLVCGLGGSKYLLIKVQSQNGLGTFDTFGIYEGVAYGGWGGAGSGFFTLNQTFSEARMTVTFSNGGDRLTLDFDTDFNGTPDQTYIADGVNLISGQFGQGYGLGAYAAASVMDNWVVGPPPTACYPDCDGDDALTLADFGCFQTKFALGDPYADCNGDLVLNLADFGCSQTAFAVGCP